jgi:hypothetical protein
VSSSPVSSRSFNIDSWSMFSSKVRLNVWVTKSSSYHVMSGWYFCKIQERAFIPRSSALLWLGCSHMNMFEWGQGSTPSRSEA